MFHLLLDNSRPSPLTPKGEISSVSTCKSKYCGRCLPFRGRGRAWQKCKLFFVFYETCQKFTFIGVKCPMIFSFLILPFFQNTKVQWNHETLRNGEKINQASWLLLLSLFFTLKTVIIST